MRRILTLTALVAVFSVLGLAESWSGRLLDSSCYDQQKSAKTCDATSTTTAFAIDVSGKVYKFDDTGNAKAAEAMKSRADRSTNPNSPPSGQIMAKVSGTKDGEALKVESVEIQ
ncbi:MAG: hypothetical protein LAP87_01520 [Acidobacteriia bacterium]|nr:hypothetical protein [Terriglobia bacterium]